MGLSIEEKDMILGFTVQDRSNMNRIVALSGAERVWSNKNAIQVLGENKMAIAKAKRLYDIVTDTDLNVPKLHDLIDMLHLQQLEEVPEQSVISKIKNHYNFMKKFGQGGEKIENSEFEKMGLGKNGSNGKLTAQVGIRKMEGKLDIYNTDRYADVEVDDEREQERIDSNRFFKLLKKGKEYTSIITKRHPMAMIEECKDKKAELKKIDDDYFELRVKNEYAGLRNRWLLVISTKMPNRDDFEGEEVTLVDGSKELKQSHCGMIMITTNRGSNIYIYGKVANANVINDEKLLERGGKWNNSNIVIGSGYRRKTLEKRLKGIARSFATKKIVVGLNGEGKEINDFMFGTRMVTFIKPKQKFQEKINWLGSLDED